jgi:hypothetical protein
VTAAAEVVTGGQNSAIVRRQPAAEGHRRRRRQRCRMKFLFGSRAVGSPRRHRFGSSFSNPAEDIYTEPDDVLTQGAHRHGGRAPCLRSWDVLTTRIARSVRAT